MRSMTLGRLVHLFTAVAAAAALACTRPAPDEPPARPAPVVAALEQQLGAAKPEAVTAGVWADAQRIYASRAHRAAWLTDGSRSADAALETIAHAPEHGLDPTRYHVANLTAALRTFDGDASAADRSERLAALDTQITTALLAYGHDVAVGTSSPTRVSSLWKPQRQAPDLAAALGKAADPAAFVAAVQPPHPQYTALVAYMRSLLAGDSGDEDRPATRSQRNRVRQVAMNLERWRWMPDAFGARHILVNIPALRLYVREGDRIVDDMNVIVGKPDGHQTPVFSSTMKTVVFSPFWNIPYGIGQDETAVAAANNPAYLTDHGIEIFRNGKLQWEGDINWFDPKDLKGLMFRQKPGSKNALGRVKFLFPNPYDVYLHDTPDDSPFAASLRALSHGCVRVADPEGLAQYVLRGDPGWTPQRIARAMSSSRETGVKLTAPLPVHIVYFTAWADADGSVKFYSDLYGYDARQARLIERSELATSGGSARSTRLNSGGGA
jgi:murein L,D-transpeptidase YcbB/YkuD